MALPPLKADDLESPRHTHEALPPLKADDLGTSGFHGQALINARNVQGNSESLGFSMNRWLSDRTDFLSYWICNSTSSGSPKQGQNGSQNTKREGMPIPYLRPSTPNGPSSADTETFERRPNSRTATDELFEGG